MTEAADSGTIGSRIRSEIEARIRSGEWGPGFRIPVEHELTETYGCSRATVSKAMGSLVSAGLIERRKRAGSFVAQPPVHAALLEIPDIATVLAARGGYRFRLLAREFAPSRLCRDIADADQVGSPGLVIEGLHLSGAEPFAHELRIIGLSEAPGADEVDFSVEAPGSWLLKQVPWSEARHRVSAVNPSGAVAAALELSPSTACLQVERSTWRNGRAVTAVVQTFPGDRYDLAGEFTPPAVSLARSV